MRFQKIIILLFIISFIGIPQISLAQTYEQLIQQGKKAASSQDFVKAEAIWREAIRRNPKDWNVWTYLGRALRLQNKLEDAFSAYQESINLNDQNPYAHNGLGNVLIEKGEFQQALAAYRKAVELNPTEPIFRDNLNNLIRYLASEKQTQGTTVTTSSSGGNVTITVNGQSISVNDSQKKPLPPPLASVVKIVTQNSLGTNYGTGWVLTKQGNSVWIVTNRHVVIDSEGNRQPSKKISVEFYSSNEIRPQFPAKIANITKETDFLDLAVLEVRDVPKSDIDVLQLSSKEVSVDTQVRVIGHPNSYYSSDWTLETGRISNIIRDKKLLQLSGVTLYPGNSGSPVLDGQNNVVGIVNYITLEDGQGKTGTAGFGYAYRIELVRNQLRTWGYGL